MSKAEDRYLEHFQDGWLRNCSSKKAFLLGYHQAEKDNELTWEDIMAIDDLLDELLPPKRSSDEFALKGYYQEVLKRFKDYKERKEK